MAENINLVRIVLDLDNKSHDLVKKSILDLSKIGKINLGPRIDSKQLKAAEKSLFQLSKKFSSQKLVFATKSERKLLREVESKYRAVGKMFDIGGRKFSGFIDKAAQNLSGALEMGSRLLMSSGQEVAKSLSSAIPKAFGKGLSSLRKTMDKRAEVLSAGGNAGGAAAMKSMGALVGAAGILATSISTILSFIVDLESRQKELNKAILQGGVSVLDMGNAYKNVGGMVDKIRTAASDKNNNLAWGTMAKDQIEIANAFGSSSLAMKNFIDLTKEGNNFTKEFTSVTSKALTYAKLFSMSATEVAGVMSSWSEELGGSLSYVEKQFALIARASKDSGYNVKWFMSSIQQATSGVAVYNSRISESVDMLSLMSRIIGAQAASARLQAASTEFRSMGVQDAYRTVKTTGDDVVKRGFQRDTENALSDFGKKIESGLSDSSISDELAEGLKRANVSVGEDGKLVGAGGGELTGDDLKNLRHYLGDISGGIFQQDIHKIEALQRGAGGDSRVMANNLDMLSAGTAQFMKMNTFREVIGGKSVHEITDDDIARIAAVQGPGGLSKEEMVHFRRIGGEMEDARSRAAGIAKQMKDNEVRKDDTEEGKAKKAAEQKRLEEEMEIITKRYGLEFDSSVGKLTDKQGRAVESFEDFWYASISKSEGAEIPDVEKDLNISLAQEIAQNTLTIGDKIEIILGALLEDIYTILSDIWSALSYDIFGSVFDKIDPRLKSQALEGSADTQRRYRDEILGFEKEIGDKKREISGLRSSDPERAKKEKELEELENRKRATASLLNIEAERGREISRATTRSGLQGATESTGVDTRIHSTVGESAGTMSNETEAMYRAILESAGFTKDILEGVDIGMYNKATMKLAEEITKKGAATGKDAFDIMAEMTPSEVSAIVEKTLRDEALSNPAVYEETTLMGRSGSVSSIRTKTQGISGRDVEEALGTAKFRSRDPQAREEIEGIVSGVSWLRSLPEGFASPPKAGGPKAGGPTPTILPAARHRNEMLTDRWAGYSTEAQTLDLDLGSKGETKTRSIAGAMVGSKISPETFSNLISAALSDEFSGEQLEQLEILTEEQKWIIEYYKKEAKNRKREEAFRKRGIETTNDKLSELIKAGEKKDAIDLLNMMGSEAGKAHVEGNMEYYEDLFGVEYTKGYLESGNITALRGADQTAHDFIYSDGTVFKINSRDEFVGMKDDGPIAAVSRSQSGGSGGLGVVININGAGNPEDVARAVHRIMERYYGK